jgi:threonine synthase
MRRIFHSESISEQETRQTISSFYRNYGILLEPHGAVGVRALELFRASHGYDDIAVCLETAHPAKFPETITSELGLEPGMPESLKHLKNRQCSSVKLPTDFKAIKEYILRHE